MQRHWCLAVVSTLALAGCADGAVEEDPDLPGAGGKADDGAAIACGDSVIEPSFAPLDGGALAGLTPSNGVPFPKYGPGDDGSFHPMWGYAEGGTYAQGTDDPEHRPRANRTLPRRDGFLRVAVWNVSRGEKLDTLIRRMKEIDADVWLLNEADLYGQLTGNTVAAREMARALGYTYYASTEFYELREDRLGMSGNAIASRYPLFDAQRIDLPILADQGGYDWTDSTSEPRCGGRSAIAARALVPNALGGTTSVRFVTPHLENKTNRDVRWAQYQAARDALTTPGEAAILGGDFNTWHFFEGSEFRGNLRDELDAAGGDADRGSPNAFMDCSLGDDATTHIAGRIDWMLLQLGQNDRIACLPGAYSVQIGDGSDHDMVVTDVFVRR
jgi:endonuclease/exonuclease/phosphatase family metal-dependent hydrolase